VVSGLSRTERNLKDALLAEIRKSKMVFYNTVIAQAQKIEVAGDRVTFTFSPNHRTLRDVFEQNRAWIESAAQQVSGRRIAVISVQSDASGAAAGPVDDAVQSASDKKSADKKTALREQAMADAGVQTMLEIFPAEIRDVEEM
jgi:DNA helicase IV